METIKGKNSGAKPPMCPLFNRGAHNTRNGRRPHNSFETWRPPVEYGESPAPMPFLPFQENSTGKIEMIATPRTLTPLQELAAAVLTRAVLDVQDPIEISDENWRVRVSREAYKFLTSKKTREQRDTFLNALPIDPQAFNDACKELKPLHAAQPASDDPYFDDDWDVVITEDDDGYVTVSYGGN